MKVRLTVNLTGFMGERIEAGTELAAQNVQGQFKDGEPRWMLWQGDRVRVRNARREWFEVLT